MGRTRLKLVAADHQNASGKPEPHVNEQRREKWRRKRDSNPRAPFDANGFQDRRFQPLTHSSFPILQCPFGFPVFVSASQPFLIGIAGPSGSGKTALARKLAPLLPRDSIVISLDSYYLPQSHLPYDERTKLNFDHPDALDWDLLLTHLDRLRHGHAVEQPIYRFEQHTRDTKTRRVPPRPFVILEGILALYSPKVRAMLDLKVFVDTRDEECLGRRIKRDVVERGRTEASVLFQYESTVRPMAAQFVLPGRDLADLVVSGEEPIGSGVERVLAWVSGRRI